MISCLEYICVLIVITFVVSLILRKCFGNQENEVNIFRCLIFFKEQLIEVWLTVSKDEKVIGDMRLNVYIFCDLMT